MKKHTTYNKFNYYQVIAILSAMGFTPCGCDAMTCGHGSICNGGRITVRYINRTESYQVVIASWWQDLEGNEQKKCEEYTCNAKEAIELALNHC